LTRVVTDRARWVQRELVRAGHHRGPGVPDLLIAATAEIYGAVVVHYDHDFDTIAVVTGSLGGAPDQLKPLVRGPDKQDLTVTPGAGMRYLGLNTTIKPFDNINVRKAVIASSDRVALQLTRGGTSAGDLATHFLPTSFPGFADAGGAKGPAPDFLRDPRGNPALAKKYMLAAKRQDPSLPIDSSGKWTGPDQFLMVASNADPGKKTGEVAQAQFEKLGFKIKFRTVPQDTLYTKFCNVPAQKIAICPNVGFFKDFNDPQSLLDPVFNGNNILAQNNSNWPELDVRAINNAMTKAAVLPAGPQRYKAWGTIDKMVTQQAPAIPYLWDKIPTVESADVRGVINQYATSWDLNFTSLK